MTVNDKFTDVSLDEENTVILPGVAKPRQPEIPRTPRTPKKTRLEPVSRSTATSKLSTATSAVLRAIKRVNVERLPEHFEQTCDWRPQEAAVICGSLRLTYQELDQQANRLAHFLISRGVRRGEPIGILLDRSLESYITLLGILKAGAAFVPLDPSFPAKRVEFIAGDARLQGIVTTSVFREKTSNLRCPVLELDLAQSEILAQQESRPQIRVDPASLCYIIYTSDAKGQPQGIAFSHANIVNFLHAFTPIYRVRRNDRVYQGLPFTFDFSLVEVWPTWIAGATLIAGPTQAQSPGHKFTDFLIENEINVLCCIPAQLAIVERDVPTLRTVLIGGEICPPHLIDRWANPGRRILSTYGPTEATIATTWSELYPHRPPTIGAVLPTSQVYILDNQLRPVRDGERGEICIGGLGITPGYTNRPDLTRERFISNPTSHDSRLYRTGDFGRITPNGEIEYLGPINTQTKSHSYRIELEEIERLLQNSGAFQLTTRALPETEAARQKKIRAINIQEIYKQVMTDPLYLNSIFNMASTFILGGLGFVFWIIIARLYTTAMVGIATTLISTMTLLSSFTIMGLNVSLNRFLPKSANKDDLINSSFVVAMIVSILVTVIYILGLQTFSPQLLFLRSNLFYSISFIIFIIFCTWNMLVESIFRAFRNASNILIKSLIVSILKLILPFGLIVFGAYGIFASNAAAFALGVVFSSIVITFRFKIRPSFSINFSLLKETSTYSFANYIANFVMGLPGLALPIITLNVLSADMAAYYYIASMIQNILLIIPMAAAQSLLTEGSYNEAELKKHVKKAAMTIVVMLIPATAVVVFAGNLLLQFFGKNYANGSFQFLQLYSISTIFTSLVLIANAIMNVKHQKKLLVISNGLGSVATLGICYALLPDKLVGIGWGWILGQVIAGLISIVLVIANRSNTADP
jgi:amino acid adenylation domain-containing protein